MSVLYPASNFNESTCPTVFSSSLVVPASLLKHMNINTTVIIHLQTVCGIFILDSCTIMKKPHALWITNLPELTISLDKLWQSFGTLNFEGDFSADLICDCDRNYLCIFSSSVIASSSAMLRFFLLDSNYRVARWRAHLDGWIVCSFICRGDICDGKSEVSCTFEYLFVQILLVFTALEWRYKCQGPHLIRKSTYSQGYKCTYQNF